MRKKFTLLFASLLACVGVMKADVTDLPQITEDLENPIYYTIYNTRSSEPGGLMYYAGDAVGLKDGCTSLTLEDKYKFFFTGTHDALYIHNAATSNKLASVSSWTEAGVEWAIGVSPKGGGLAIGPKGGLSGESCINEKNYSTSETTSDFTTWSANDAGSIFVVELAENSVFPVTDLFYTIECPLFENVQGIAKGLVAAADGSLSWNTVDLTNKNFYWTLVESEDSVVLKNVGTGLYLNGDAVGETGAAVTLGALGSNQFNITTNEVKVHANGHGGGANASGGIVHYGGSVNSASAWSFVEREDPNAVVAVSVNYSFKYGGEEKYTQTVSTIEGEEWPGIAVSLPFGVSAVKPEGTIAAGDHTDGVANKEFELSVNLPFVPAASYDEITHWYYMNIRDDGPTYLAYDSSKEYIPARATSVDLDNKDNYTWAFIGDPFNGYQIVNYAAGKTMVLSAPIAPTGNQNAAELARMTQADTIVNGNKTWMFYNPTHNNAAVNSFYVQHPTASAYAFNRQNYDGVNSLCYWTGRDTGSAVQLVERDMSGATDLQALIDAVETNDYSEGTTVGYIKSLATLNTAIANAKVAVESKTGCFEAAEALQTAIAALETVQPDTTKFYTIVNAMPSTDKRGGQMMYVNADSCMQFRPEYSDSALFQFKDAGEGKFYLYNVVNKTYLSTAKAHGKGQAEVKADSIENAKPVVITNMGRSNVVKIVPEGGAMLHAQADGSKVVGWNNDDNMNASAWIIVENIEVEKVALDTKAIEFLTLDSIVQLTATVSPDEATYKNVTWATDNDKVATVDAEGRVTSVGNGEAIITATAPNGKADTCKVTVDATIVEVVWVELNMESITFVTADSTVQLIATIVPDDATYKNIKWSSSAETVATVDDNGLVTPVGNGTSIITATAANGKSEECLVTVNIPIEVAEVKLDKAEATLTTAGATVQLTATVAPEDAWDKTITWTSDNDKVATVDQTGKVTAVADGIATITATAANGVKATCKVTVAILVEVAEITLDKESIEFVSADSTVQIVAIIAPDNATDKTITWSSSDEKVATVDQTGQVTSVANGTATITATTANGKTATCTVTVNIPEENGIDNITADKELIIYDLHGRRVTTMEKGIYIVNGKKVVVK